MKNKKILFSLFCLLLAACSSKSSFTPVQVEIPNNLKDKTEVLTLIDQMTETSNKVARSMQKIVTITGGREVDSTSELSTMQMLSMAKEAVVMSKAATKYEQYQAERKRINQKLSAAEIQSLDLVCKQLERQMSKIDTSGLNLAHGKSMQASAELQTHNMEPVADQAQNANIPSGEDDPHALQAMQDELPAQSSSSPFGFIIPLVVLGIIIFGIVFGIKKFKSRLKDMSYTFSEVKSAVSDAKNRTESAHRQKDWSKEEEEAMNSLSDLTDKF